MEVLLNVPIMNIPRVVKSILSMCDQLVVIASLEFEEDRRPLSHSTESQHFAGFWRFKFDSIYATSIPRLKQGKQLNAKAKRKEEALNVITMLHRYACHVQKQELFRLHHHPYSITFRSLVVIVQETKPSSATEAHSKFSPSLRNVIEQQVLLAAFQAGDFVKESTIQPFVQ